MHRPLLIPAFIEVQGKFTGDFSHPGTIAGYQPLPQNPVQSYLVCLPQPFIDDLTIERMLKPVTGGRSTIGPDDQIELADQRSQSHQFFTAGVDLLRICLQAGSQRRRRKGFAGDTGDLQQFFAQVPAAVRTG
jgi:hypothetical protein